MKKKILRILRDLAITLVLLSAATAVGWEFWSLQLHETNIAVTYLLSVLLIALFTKGYFYGLGATLLSILVYNWFFTEPYFTLKVNDPTYMITFVIMALTSFITSTLTSKVKQVAAKDKEKQEEMSALYQLTNHLTDAEDLDTIAEIAVKAVSNLLSTEAACIVFDGAADKPNTFLQQRSDGTQVRRELPNLPAIQNWLETMVTPVQIGKEFYDYPVYGRNAVLAVMRIPSQDAEVLTDTQIRMLHSVMESTSLALERMRSLQEQAAVREQVAQERYRSNLLRAISHDIRTPLSGIMGTSEMLMDMCDQEDPRYTMARDIHQDTNWLHSLVENILNLTKLQDGRMKLNKQPEAVEEVIGAVLSVMEKRLPGREISLDIPEKLLMVPMDAKLISQVLVNLLDNAAKHSPENSPLEIAVWEEPDSNAIGFSISDHGTGIAPDVMPHIFQMFYTTHGEGKGETRGVGLGLAICQSIVEAHGGTISSHNRQDGPGAVFTFLLPQEDPKHD